ncbi:MAG TPA: NAD(+)/NADH kinase [Aggregatilineales bacterium]|nr:NAD(+)/NADH kinase [Anaerolineales bacterium]HRE46117.1 NAD(+)/NADH kinase [Aggregatilineales bacterium]
MFKRVGVLGHPLRPITAEVCSEVAQTVRQRGAEAWCYTTWGAAEIRPQVAESDLIIAIGGDGSMLRAARLAAQYDVPVFGINAGHLGFLTESSLSEWDQALERLFSGMYWIETRMMIRAETWRNDSRLLVENALNDVVVSRGGASRSILVETYIDGGWTTTYNADGVIIATPTGSTAYALAVGGPILPPELANILVIPVAPHLSLDRPLVLAKGAVVELRIPDETMSEAMLTVDGENLNPLRSGDSIVVQGSEHRARFVRLRERHYFYRSLLDRLEPHEPSRRARQPYQPRRARLDALAEDMPS